MTPSRRLLLSLLLAALIPACGTETEEADEDKPPGNFFVPDVVFLMERENAGIDEVFVCDLEGTRLVKVSGATAGEIGTFAWSPNRKWIAFSGEKEGLGLFGVYVLPASGPGVPIRVSLLGVDFIQDLIWAPDSSRIAYMKLGTAQAVCTALPDVFESEVQVSGAVAGAMRAYRWAPNSSRIAYAADQDTAGIIELYTSLPATAVGNVKVNGTLVAGRSLRLTDSFAWAPNSSRIAYVADQDTNDRAELYTSLPTGAAGNIKISGPTSVSALGVQTFAWAPNSVRIAYVADQDSAALNEIYTSPAATAVGNVKLNAPGISVGSKFDWAPNSSRVAFLQSGRLFTVFPSGAGSANPHPTLPGGRDVTLWSWSPNSTRIAYVADQDSDDVFELFTATSTGGSNLKVSGPMAAGAQVDLVNWSPDSIRLVYHANADGATPQFFATLADGSTDAVQLSSAVTNSGFPVAAWTDDSRRVVFSNQHDVPDHAELFASDPDTGTIVKLSGPFLSATQGDFCIFFVR